MIVTNIEPSATKEGLYIITFDEDKKKILPLQVIDKYGIFVGVDIDIVELRDILNENVRHRAMEKAQQCLARREYARLELQRKLMSSFDSEIIESVLETLVEMDLINDKRYAENLAYNYIELRQYGRFRAFHEICRRGVPKEIAEDVLKIYELTAEDRIKKIINQKYLHTLTDPDDYKSIHRTKAALARRGFSFNDINKVILRILEEVKYAQEDAEYEQDGNDTQDE
jgi:regulatory protein